MSNVREVVTHMTLGAPGGLVVALRRDANGNDLTVTVDNPDDEGPVRFVLPTWCARSFAAAIGQMFPSDRGDGGIDP